jgi:hypothetical protein
MMQSFTPGIIMEAETVSKTLKIHCTLTWVIAKNYFIPTKNAFEKYAYSILITFTHLFTAVFSVYGRKITAADE